MMESNGKRRGFIKGKLMPFYGATKPASAMQYTTAVKSNMASTTASVSYRIHPDYMISQPKQVSFIVPADKNREIDNLFGVAGDESVDIKAANYISSAQERFKLEKQV